MKRYFSAMIQCVLLCTSSFIVLSCDKNDPDIEYEEVVTSNVSLPSFDKYLTTTDADGFSIRIRFKNGGDVRENMSCTVYWEAFTNKPSSTPTKRGLTNSEQMSIYNHTKTKTTFDKSHAGYRGGTYIYYYAECQNSKGSCETDVAYAIVKR